VFTLQEKGVLSDVFSATCSLTGGNQFRSQLQRRASISRPVTGEPRTPLSLGTIGSASSFSSSAESTYPEQRRDKITLPPFLSARSDRLLFSSSILVEHVKAGDGRQTGPPSPIARSDRLLLSPLALNQRIQASGGARPPPLFSLQDRIVFVFLFQC